MFEAFWSWDFLCGKFFKITNSITLFVISLFRIYTGVGKSRFTAVIQINNVIINKQYKNKLFHELTTVSLRLPTLYFFLRKLSS